MIRAYTNSAHISCKDRLTLLYSSGSAGTITFCNALLNGAAIFPFSVKKEGVVGLADWLIEEEITIYNSVVTLFRHFVNTLTGKEEFAKLRLIHIGGEPIYKRDVELYKKHFSQDCILTAHFGSVEALPIREYFICKDTSVVGNIVPVGYKVDDMDVFLVDSRGQEIECDKVGEVVVRSRYLSLGYWRKPELTQERFLLDPNGGDKRIFFTGDLGRMAPDGCLTHLGRRDFQVKVRGYRIETAEVEAALLDLPGVAGAVVTAAREHVSDNRLIAYVVPDGSFKSKVTGLRSQLVDKLPDYMVPSYFLFMEKFPLSTSGKVDRLALPKPDSTRPDLETPFVAPKTPIEQTLAIIWENALGIDQVGLNDNFFDLGGHSLLASQIISQVISTFRVKIPLQFLFQSPTVADMAVVILQYSAEQIADDEVVDLLTKLENYSEDEAKSLINRETKNSQRKQRS
jgi:acyl-CoA synthetase (AMP-forming)/AMP-acid ligase II/acyl carrier protein